MGKQLLEKYEKKLRESLLNALTVGDPHLAASCASKLARIQRRRKKRGGYDILQK